MDPEALVIRFFDAIEQRDFDTFRAAFAPNARIHQNGFRLDVDALIRSTEAGSRSVRYSNRRRIVSEMACVEQHDAEIILADGSQVDVRDLCLVFRFDGQGRIVEIDEYVTPQKPTA